MLLFCSIKNINIVNIAKLAEGRNPWVSKIFYFPKKVASCSILSSFQMKIKRFFAKTSKNGLLFFLLSPRDVKYILEIVK